MGNLTNELEAYSKDQNVESSVSCYIVYYKLAVLPYEHDVTSTEDFVGFSSNMTYVFF